MSNENSANSAFSNFNTFNLDLPPLGTEQVHSAPVDDWANQRFAIYASLDAAMSRSVVEAVRSLNELNQQVEEEARLKLMDLSAERQALQREIEVLRSERASLKNEIRQAQRELEEMRAVRLTLEGREVEKSADLATVQERVGRDINHLTHEVESLGYQVQGFIEQRFNQLWQDFMEILAIQGQPVPSLSATSTLLQPRPGFTFEKAAERLPRPITPPSRPASVLSDAGGFPTERVVLTADVLAQLKRVQHYIEENAPLAVDPLDEQALAPETTEFAEFGDTPTPRLAGGSQVIKPAVPEKATSSFDTPFKEAASANLSSPLIAVSPTPSSKTWVDTFATIEDKPTARPLRKQSIERQIEALLKRRTPEDSAKMAAISSELLEDSPEMSFEEIPAITLRPRSAAALNYSKEGLRVELEEIAAKLGYEVVTPPSLTAVRFGPGFKPRSLNGSPPHTDRFEVSAAPLPPETVSSSVSPSLLEEVEELVTPSGFETEKDELTTPAPKIGEIGEDLAHEFPNRNFGLPPLPERPAMTVPPMPARALEALPPVPVPPVPSNPESDHSSADDLQTRVTISNLQGLALLTMEKAVRGLAGVHHVTVTDFRKGVLEMDVAHASGVKLEEVLPALSDLHLMLVERGPNSLEFLQEK